MDINDYVDNVRECPDLFYEDPKTTRIKKGMKCYAANTIEGLDRMIVERPKPQILEKLWYWDDKCFMVNGAYYKYLYILE